MASQRSTPRATTSAHAFALGRARVTASAFPLRFELFDPDRAPPQKPSRAPLLLIPAVIAALVVVALVRSMIVRALLPLAIAIAALALWTQRSRMKEREAKERAGRRALILEETKLLFYPGKGEPRHLVMDLSRPFGITLLSTHRRDRLVLIVTSETGAFHIGALVGNTPIAHLAPLFLHATTVAGEDAAFEVIGPDERPVLLTPDELADLMQAFHTLDPACLDRVIVTDTKGAKVILDDDQLRVDSLAFDLHAPLEWRALVFQEPFGQVMTLYQGTWIRQNGSEVVLISLLPSLGPILEVEPGEIATLDRAVLRDLRLMQASAEAPPPRAQRHAIERLLMMPIRSSLDRAPRQSKQPPPPSPPLH